MGKFEISANGKKYEITAPDQASAIAAFQKFNGGHAAPAANPYEAASQASQQLKSGPVTQMQPPPQPKPDLLTNTVATVQGLTGSIPFLNQAGDAMLSVPSLFTGGTEGFGQTYNGLQQRRQEIAQQAPVASMAGTVAGALAPYAAATKIPALAEALGMSGGFGQRVVNSLASGAGISGSQALSQGKPSSEVLADMAYGGGISAAIPVVGGALKVVAAPILRPIAETVRGALNPAKEAAKGVGQALRRDAANFSAPILSSADEAAARMNGQPILNVDRGGETTRALMRSAANQNPEARGIVERTAEDRFRTQAARTTDFFRRVMGGNVDDLARRAQINSEARLANSPAYRRAYSDPNAQAVWNSQTQQLMQSDSFRTAVQAATSRGTDVAAAQGVKAVRSPFVFGKDGSVGLKRNPDGSVAYPSLEFWNQVKRELDAKIGLAKRAGDDVTTADLMGLKTALVNNLDSLVPSYAKARQTAMSFFDAEDAVDAGRKAFASPKAIDESLAAFNSMTKSEKDDFAVGMASQIMDDVRGTNNRANLMRMFDIPARKELMAAALGPAKAKQFEAFVRVEDIMDKMRGALGNSTTARQLMEMGIMGGLSAGAGGLNLATGGNINTAAATGLLVAAGRFGLRAVRGNVNAQVLQRVAQMLASGNKAEIDKAMANALLSEQHMLALEAIQKGIGAALRGGSQVAIAAQ